MNGYEPMVWNREGAVVWWVGRRDIPSDTSDLPPSVFYRLTGGYPVTSKCRWYPTRQHALQALAESLARARQT